jgi:hypothetical protein
VKTFLKWKYEVTLATDANEKAKKDGIVAIVAESFMAEE